MKRALVGMMVVAALFGAGCSGSSSDGGGSDAEGTTSAPASSETTTTEAAPEPIEDQTPPTSINGITVDGDTIWIASIEDDELLQVDRESGAILQRFATDGAGPDDVAVAPDGSVWSTGFANGDLGRVADGSYEVVTEMTSGINPIAVDAEGIVWVATYGPDGSLFRIDPEDVPDEGEALEPVADGSLPDINAFGILGDGSLLAPAGGIAGPGSAIAIDPETGEYTTVVDGLPGVAAATVDDEGDPYVLANATGEVFAIDVEAGTSEVVRKVEEGVPFDNLAFAADGTLYLSSFVSPTITEVASDGTERVITIGQ